MDGYLAEAFLAWCVTVAVYKENVRFQAFYIFFEVEDAAAAVYKCIFYITDCLYHV